MGANLSSGGAADKHGHGERDRAGRDGGSDLGDLDRDGHH
jgi:hypothetical protein